MKLQRFFSLFLLLCLLCALLPPQSARAEEEFDVAAKGAILVEAATDEVLYEKNAHAKLYPASITKVMTALLIFEAVDAGELTLDREVTASATAFEGLAADGSTANIKAGEVLTVEQLLNCMLIVSANEACNILAEALCGEGNVEHFVARMNERAQMLGCENTHYVNTNGLHHEQHYSSAYDIYLVTREALKHEKFLTICNSKSAEIPATNLSAKRTLHSTNALISNWRRIGYLYRDAQGIKTGSTPEAGQCLVSSAVRGGRTLISVVLGAEIAQINDKTTKIMSFVETARLFDHGFNDFTRRQILSSAEPICEVPVALSSETNYVVVHPAQTLSRMLPNDLDVAALERTVSVAESVDAPIAAGDVLGTITISYGDTIYGTADLLALSDVSASWILTAKRAALQFLARTWVKIAVIAAAALLVLILIVRIVNSSRRRRRRSSPRYSAGNYRGKRKGKMRSAR